MDPWRSWLSREVEALETPVQLGQDPPNYWEVGKLETPPGFEPGVSNDTAGSNPAFPANTVHPSSSGRTRDFESLNLGSNPRG